MGESASQKKRESTTLLSEKTKLHQNNTPPNKCRIHRAPFNVGLAGGQFIICLGGGPPNTFTHSSSSPYLRIRKESVSE